MDDPRAVLAARQGVAEAISDWDGHVLVACSGGSDSLGLVHALAWEAPAHPVSTSAIIIDHGITAGSAERAARALAEVEAVMTGVVRRVEVSSAGGPEAAARQARYEAIAAHARTFPAPVLVLLGHTRDDQAETVLLGLARGSGPRSIAGMAVRGSLPGHPDVACARPFLHLDKDTIRRACQSWGASPVEDPTNSMDGPWRAADGSALRRSAVRDRALPALSEALGVDARVGLARTASLLQVDAHYLDEQASLALDEVRLDGGGLDVGLLTGLHEAIGTRVVRSWLLAAGVSPGKLLGVHVRTVWELAHKGRGQASVPGVNVTVSGGVAQVR